ncbi:ATP-binding protein [Streptomyces bauhiniae]|uniref:ATP-binding protein n=1 Tax=Streptomyces bauhiniae TaxID=2340725 RepID=UPI0037D50DF3
MRHHASVRSSHTALPTGSLAFETAFLPTPRRVGEMRQMTAGFLRLVDVSGEVGGDVLLAVSELVTNAIRHGGGEIVLRLSFDQFKVRISVTDQNPRKAQLKHAGPDDESGRGLALIAAFAHSWGSDGEKTWCVFHCSPDAAGAVEA